MPINLEDLKDVFKQEEDDKRNIQLQKLELAKRKQELDEKKFEQQIKENEQKINQQEQRLTKRSDIVWLIGLALSIGLLAISFLFFIVVVLKG